MKTNAVPIASVVENEHRFDCGPFTRGAIETKKALEMISARKDKLAQLTRGGISGIYHVGMDKLRWVDRPEYGIRFVGSADILRADLSSQPFISKKQVAENPLFT